MNRMSPTRSSHMALFVALLACEAHASEVTWTGGSATGSNWTDAFNWAFLDRPDNDGTTDVLFPSQTQRATSTVNQGYSIRQIRFGSGAVDPVSYAIGGTGTLGLRSGIFNASTAQQSVQAPIRLDQDIVLQSNVAGNAGGRLAVGAVNLNGRTLTTRSGQNPVRIEGAVSGSGTIAHRGPGVLSLNAASSFAGRMAIFGGTVDFAFGSTLGSLTNVITFEGTGSDVPALRRIGTGGLALPVSIGGIGGSLSVLPGQTLTMTGVVGQVGGADAGSHLYKDGGGTLRLDGTLAYAGSTIVRAGVLSAGTRLPRTPVDVHTGATLELRGQSHTIPSLVSAGAIQLNDHAELILGWTNNSDDGAATINAPVSGNGRLVKRGNQTARLSAASTFSGGTEISGGTLIATNSTSSTGTGTVSVVALGVLTGKGRIAGPLSASSFGTIAPGEPTGTLHVGDVSLAGAGYLHSRLRGTSESNIGRLSATGSVALSGGRLRLELLGDYTPALNATHDLILATSITGTFSTIEGIALPGPDDRRMAVLYTFDGPTSVVRARVARAGDANVDNLVNFADLLIVAQNFEQPGPQTWARGDFDGNASVSFADLLAVAQQYETPASFQSDWAQARALVPEPATLSLVLASSVLLARRR